MWHIETDIFAIIIMVILAVKNMVNDIERTQQDRLLSVMLWCSGAVTVIDLVSSIAMNISQNWYFYQIIMDLYYATAALLPCLWLLYSFIIIDGGKLKLTFVKFAVTFIPEILIMIVSISNPWTEAIFSLTDDMVYARGPAFKLFTFLYLVYYPAIGILTTIIFNKKIVPRSNIIAMLCFFLAIPVSTYIQLSYPGTLIICLAFAVIYIIDDVTIENERRNRLYAQLVKKNAQLEEAMELTNKANEAKTQFVSRISHDIRTPIGAILNLTEFAREDVDDEEKINDDLDKISTSGRFLLSLINDVLDISKIDSGGIAIKSDSYDYDEYVSEIRNILVPMCDEKNLTCTISPGEPLCKAFLTDRVRLNQITLNIISNAVKYTPKGGKVAFRPFMYKNTNGTVELHFEVKDNGIGISEEFQKEIYEEFAQEKNNPMLCRVDAVGSGLGLPIAKKLLDLMGGTISISSELGLGTTVEVMVPVTPVEVSEDEEEQTSDTKNTTYRGTVLVAEDNEY